MSKDVNVVEAEDGADTHVAICDHIEEAGFSTEEWDEILAREFDTFKKGEKYDYVTDLRRTFDQGLSTSSYEKVFRKLPEHVFWDIKKPLTKGEEYYVNPYNAARAYPFNSFFDMRSHEDWI